MPQRWRLLTDDAPEFRYASGCKPQKPGAYTNDDLGDQREYLGRKLDTMKYRSPGNDTYIGTILYSPGKREYIRTSHPDSKSVTFRQPVLEHATTTLNNALTHTHVDDEYSDLFYV